jgi:hypothetical protein
MWFASPLKGAASRWRMEDGGVASAARELNSVGDHES